MIACSDTCFGEKLPEAYGGCPCHCHRHPGVQHVMACCFPTKEDKETLPSLDFSHEPKSS